MDDRDWAIRYLICDTRDWLPGKKVPFPAARVSGISWAGTVAEVDLTPHEIRTAPEWRAGMTMDRRYETEVHAHYGRTPYWVGRHDDANRRRNT